MMEKEVEKRLKMQCVSHACVSRVKKNKKRKPIDSPRQSGKDRIDAIKKKRKKRIDGRALFACAVSPSLD